MAVSESAACSAEGTMECGGSRVTVGSRWFSGRGRRCMQVQDTICVQYGVEKEKLVKPGGVFSLASF
jgi:hypothetical protein